MKAGREAGEEGGTRHFNQPVMRQLGCANAQFRLRAGMC